MLIAIVNQIIDKFSNLCDHIGFTMQNTIKPTCRNQHSLRWQVRKLTSKLMFVRFTPEYISLSVKAARKKWKERHTLQSVLCTVISAKIKDTLPKAIRLNKSSLMIIKY